MLEFGSRYKKEEPQFPYTVFSGETPDAWTTSFDATPVGRTIVWPFEKVTSLVPFPRFSTAVVVVVVSGATTAPAGGPDPVELLEMAGVELAPALDGINSTPRNAAVARGVRSLREAVIIAGFSFV
jgi:hypothetical protein